MARQVWLALALSLVCASVSTAQAGGNTQSVVKVTATADKLLPDGRQQILVVLEVAADCFVYANPVGNEELRLNATVIRVASKDKLASVKIAYPAGDLQQDRLIGDYRIYQGRVEIPVAVRRTAGAEEPLEVSVRYNMLNLKKGLCWPVQQVKFTLP
jgi:hypothetical protein